MKAPIPDEEENLIVEYIYITYLIPILEEDHHAVEFLKFKIPEVYQDFIENRLKELRRELVALKAKMKELKIKVAVPYVVNVDFVEYPYFAHGYEGLMRFWNAAMRYEATRRLEKLFKGKQ